MMPFTHDKMTPLAIDLLKSGNFRDKDVLLNSDIYPLVVCHFIKEFLSKEGPVKSDYLARNLKFKSLESFVKKGKHEQIFKPFLYAWKESPNKYLEYLALNYTFDKSFVYDRGTDLWSPIKKSNKRFVITTIAPMIAHLIYKGVTVKSVSDALNVGYYTLHSSLMYYNVLPGNYVKMKRKNSHGKNICSKPGCTREKAPNNRFLCMACYKSATDYDDVEHSILLDTPPGGDIW